MVLLEFTKTLTSKPEKLLEIASDFDNVSKLVPTNMKSKIVKQSNNETITEEILKFSIMNKEITQQTIHKVDTKKLESHILSGPFKDSVVMMSYEKINSGTKVTIKANLKISLKYFFLSNFIKKKYQKALESILNQADNLAQLTNDKSWKESLREDGETLTIFKDTIPITLYHWYHSAMTDVFQKEIYSFLPVENKIVIDLGANIGDSSIYFAIKNAKKVIALEPFPKIYEIAKRNVQINNLDNKIILLKAGCSSKLGTILLNPDTEGTGTSISFHKNGVEIPTFTLDHLVKEYDIESGILKIDCEGCEYDAIMGSTNEILQKFSHILIEFHNGYENLKSKLEESNFVVDVNVISQKRVSGYIYAAQKHQN